METHQQELDRLTAEQAADDTPTQVPQRFGAAGRDRVLSIDALGMADMAGSALDGVTVSGVGLGGDYDEAKGPGLVGRYRQRTQRALWSNVSDANGDAARIVREAVAGMTDEQRETFRLVYAERLSYREAAARLDITVSSVRDRIETLKRIVTRALVAAAGGEAE